MRWCHPALPGLLQDGFSTFNTYLIAGNLSESPALSLVSALLVDPLVGISASLSQTFLCHLHTSSGTAAEGTQRASLGKALPSPGLRSCRVCSSSPQGVGLPKQTGPSALESCQKSSAADLKERKEHGNLIQKTNTHFPVSASAPQAAPRVQTGSSETPLTFSPALFLSLPHLRQRISLELLIPHPSDLNLPYPGHSQGSVPVTAHAGGKSFVLVTPTLLALH